MRSGKLITQEAFARKMVSSNDEIAARATRSRGARPIVQLILDWSLFSTFVTPGQPGCNSGVILLSPGVHASLENDGRIVHADLNVFASKRPGVERRSDLTFDIGAFIATYLDVIDYGLDAHQKAYGPSAMLFW